MAADQHPLHPHQAEQAPWPPALPAEPLLQAAKQMDVTNACPEDSQQAPSADLVDATGGQPTVLEKLQKWGDYESIGQPVAPTHFVPMKTPLSETILAAWSLPVAPRFRLTVADLLASQAAAGRKLGLILDLSNHDTLYAEDLPRAPGVRYEHVQLVAKVLPGRAQVARVIALAAAFWREHPDEYIAIHCAYGFNRTGFVVCCYLIQEVGLSVDAALAAFAAARPPGVKHEKFIAELRRRYEAGSACDSSSDGELHWANSSLAGHSDGRSAPTAHASGRTSPRPGEDAWRPDSAGGPRSSRAAGALEDRSATPEQSCGSPRIASSAGGSPRGSEGGGSWAALGQRSASGDNLSLGFDQRQALAHLAARPQLWEQEVTSRPQPGAAGGDALLLSPMARLTFSQLSDKDGASAEDLVRPATPRTPRTPLNELVAALAEEEERAGGAGAERDRSGSGAQGSPDSGRRSGSGSWHRGERVLPAAERSNSSSPPHGLSQGRETSSATEWGALGPASSTAGGPEAAAGSVGCLPKGRRSCDGRPGVLGSLRQLCQRGLAKLA